MCGASEACVHHASSWHHSCAFSSAVFSLSPGKVWKTSQIHLHGWTGGDWGEGGGEGEGGGGVGSGSGGGRGRRRRGRRVHELWGGGRRAGRRDARLDVVEDARGDLGAHVVAREAVAAVERARAVVPLGDARSGRRGWRRRHERRGRGRRWRGDTSRAAAGRGGLGGGMGGRGGLGERRGRRRAATGGGPGCGGGAGCAHRRPSPRRRTRRGRPRSPLGMSVPREPRQEARCQQHMSGASPAVGAAARASSRPPRLARPPCRPPCRLVGHLDDHGHQLGARGHALMPMSRRTSTRQRSAPWRKAIALTFSPR